MSSVRGWAYSHQLSEYELYKGREKPRFRKRDRSIEKKFVQVTILVQLVRKMSSQHILERVAIPYRQQLESPICQQDNSRTNTSAVTSRLLYDSIHRSSLANQIFRSFTYCICSHRPRRAFILYTRIFIQQYLNVISATRTEIRGVASSLTQIQGGVGGDVALLRRRNFALVFVLSLTVFLIRIDFLILIFVFDYIIHFATSLTARNRDSQSCNWLYKYLTYGQQNIYAMANTRHYQIWKS